MDLIVVKKIPERERAKTPEKKLLELLEEFADSEATVVRLEWSPEEFGTQYSTTSALRRIIKRWNYPFLVVMDYRDVYITKDA